MARTVRVHDDTHRVLKELKARRRSRSIDQVIREMIKSAGASVEEPSLGTDGLNAYLDG